MNTRCEVTYWLAVMLGMNSSVITLAACPSSRVLSSVTAFPMIVHYHEFTPAFLHSSTRTSQMELVRD